MTASRTISIAFSEGGERISATLLDAVAPVTCDAVWQLAAASVPMSIRHVIFSGRELGIHVPYQVAEEIPEFVRHPPENQSVFPAPGDIMFQYCPPYQFAGDPEPVYDVSICYGPDTRLFMPWGWSPANRFAAVHVQDRAVLAAIGGRLVSSRSDTVTFSQQIPADNGLVVLANGDRELDARTIEPAERHTAIFDAYHDLAEGANFILVNDHEPKSLFYHFSAEYAGRFTWEFIDRGPTVWRIRLTKTAGPAA